MFLSPYYSRADILDARLGSGELTIVAGPHLVPVAYSDNGRSSTGCQFCGM
jgi:hypothetical protein